MLNSTICVVATVTVTAAAVSWVLTFTPWARYLPSAYFVPFFVLMFPSFGWSVYVLKAERRPPAPPGPPKPGPPPAPRRPLTDPLEELERAKVPLALAGAAAVVSFMTGMPSLPGQPGYDKQRHRYFYSNHGTLIPATRTGYLHAVAAQNRLFLGVSLVFLTAAVAVTWQERNRRRGTPAQSADQDVLGAA